MKKKPAGNDSKQRRDVVRHFKSCAARGTLIGNYFVELSAVGDRSLCPYLRSLPATSQDELQREWIDVLCAWFDGGAANLEMLAASDRYRSMCLSVLAENRSPENLAAMARIIPLRFRLPSTLHACESQSGWAMVVSRSLNIGPPLKLDEATQHRLRKFTTLLIAKGVAKTNRLVKKEGSPVSRGRCASGGDVFYITPALHLLKFVGTRESIDLIRGLPDWSAAGRDLGPEVIRIIQKRHEHAQ